LWHIASSADVTPHKFITFLKRPFNFVEARAIQYAIRHSTHVVTPARFLDNLLKKHYKRASNIILQMQPEATELLIKKEVFTICWVANIKPLKQPEIFINLAQRFDRAKNIRFIMIGRPSNGKYQAKLDTSIGFLNNLDYYGEQPTHKVNEILAASHVFVNTSTYEGFPNTFVQAWMREVPVVSMLLDPDNILKTQKIGYHSGSFEQMVKDVEKLIHNPALRNDMGKRAQIYAMKNHSLEKNMVQLIDLIIS
jgi:glycosyltransferase involved in cell wall biosynthesis